MFPKIVMRSYVLAVVYSCVILCLLSGMKGISRVYGQSGSTTGMIVGRVKDVGGAVIAGAPVKARQIETNLERTADADEDGNYQFLQLPPGNYEVMVELEGFAIKKERVLINIGTSALVQLTLVPEGAVETVNVEAAVSFEQGKTESSAINGSDRIDNLPINRRNFLDFAVTAPRVTVDRLPVQGVAATSGLSFNGQSSRQNNVTIDGLDNNDSNVGTVRSTFSQEAVREFQVVSDSYSAEFGRALGGVVNIVTKGGTNDHHGTTFFFVRNDAVSARNAFADENPPYKQYQFGATVGGPIKKDKLFYFGSFERLSVKQNNIVTIPESIVQSARRIGFSYVDNGAQPFALGNTSVLARTDMQVNANNLLTLRYNYGGTFDGNFEPFGALTDRSNSGTQRLNDNQFAASNTYINANLNMVNETRFLYSHRSQDVLTDTVGPRVSINSGDVGRIIFGPPIFLNQPRRVNIFQIVDNVSLSRGNHQIKFGVDFLRIMAKNRLPSREQGSITFNDLDLRFIGLPGDGFFRAIEAFDPSLRSADQKTFLSALAPLVPLFANSPNFPDNLDLANLPLPTFYAQGFISQKPLEVAQNFFSAFIQDDIKLRDNLMLKLGLRYDRFTTQFLDGNRGDFSPRVALSYTPSKFPKLSLYATYGLFFATPNIGPIFAAFPKGRSTSFQLLPETILTFQRPTRNFPVSDQIPENVGFARQFGLEDQVQQDLQTSYTQQTGLGFNYFITPKTILNISYNYTRGIRLFGTRDVNPVVRPEPILAQSYLNGRVDTTRGAVLYYESAFDSYFHGLSTSINRRFANNFGFQASYTFSKTIDNSSDYVGGVQEIENVFNLRSERGLSLQDVRHRFLLSGSWDLNYTQNKFLKNFSLSTIIAINSGRPFNLQAGADLDSNDVLYDRPQVIGPDGVSRPVGRNVGVSPSFSNVDLRLTRNFSIKERYAVSVIAEVFNLFNRVNIDQFNRIFQRDADGNFNLPPQESGRYIVTRNRYLSSFSPRLFQFGVRLTF
ncbi:MAG TPA: TonB-dependent receptor [Acidobacteriota bacterium]|nr:TonB-dependent receptor [Acidobacteriota bacterium]HNG91358.1 TonB-dependent receptor [Acidobacteriota bacterium]